MYLYTVYTVHISPIGPNVN